MINALLRAEADAVCGAEYGPAQSPERVNSRNGYRHRELDTRVGTIDVAIPKLRSGHLLPGLAAGAAQARRVRADQRGGDLLPAGGVDPPDGQARADAGDHRAVASRRSRGWPPTSTSRSTAFRTRPLGEAGPFTFVAADALTMKVREDGRVVNAVVLVATGVNGDGHREVLGVKVATSETRHGVERVLRRPGRPRPDRRPTGCCWSPATPTPGWSRRSRRTCPAPAGSAAAPTTPRT